MVLIMCYLQTEVEHTMLLLGERAEFSYILKQTFSHTWCHSEMDYRLQFLSFLVFFSLNDVQAINKEPVVGTVDVTVLKEQLRHRRDSTSYIRHSASAL